MIGAPENLEYLGRRRFHEFSESARRKIAHPYGSGGLISST